IRNVGVGRAAGRALFGDSYRVASGIARLLHAAVSTEVGSESRVDENPIRHRRGPGDLLHALEPVGIASARPSRARAARLWRERWRPTIDETGRRLCATSFFPLRPCRPGAWFLLVPEGTDLVALGRLKGQSQARDSVTTRGTGLARQVGLVRPLRRVAGILVRPHSWNRAVRALFTRDRVEPHAVPHDGCTNADTEVQQLEQLTGHGQASSLQFVGVVVADHPLAHRRRVEATFERVAAGLWHDAQRQTAHI